MHWLVVKGYSTKDYFLNTVFMEGSVFKNGYTILEDDTCVLINGWYNIINSNYNILICSIYRNFQKISPLEKI